jgi:hypothetical protein
VAKRLFVGQAGKYWERQHIYEDSRVKFLVMLHMTSQIAFECTAILFHFNQTFVYTATCGPNLKKIYKTLSSTSQVFHIGQADRRRDRGAENHTEIIIIIIIIIMLLF